MEQMSNLEFDLEPEEAETLTSPEQLNKTSCELRAVFTWEAVEGGGDRRCWR